MSKAKQLWTQFLQTKQHAANPNTRRRYHGVNIGNTTYTPEIFLEFDAFVRSMGYVAYGWKGKARLDGMKWFSSGVGPHSYSKDFPADQSHWIAFYCTTDYSVAEGYLVAGTLMLRVYIHQSKINNIFNLGHYADMDSDPASAMMLQARMKQPLPSLFGLSGPQGGVNRDPETAIIGSSLGQNLLVVPIPASLDKRYMLQNTHAKGLLNNYNLPARPVDQFLVFLQNLV